MHPLREWLFRTVANEVSFRGINGIHLKQLANDGGVNSDLVHKYFPDKHALIFGLIDEICAAQKDFILLHFQQVSSESFYLVFLPNESGFSHQQPQPFEE